MKYKVLACAVWALVPACQAEIGPMGNADEGGSSGEPGGSGGEGGEGPGSPGSCGEAALLPRARLWRLSGAQYANTVQSVLGLSADTSGFPADSVSDDALTKFDTNADKNVVNDRLAGVYEAEATRLAKEYVQKLASSNACILAASPAADCVKSWVAEFAGKAFRRPVDGAEADRMAAFHAKARTAFGSEVAARMTLEAILQSPHFLYRFELGNDKAGTKVALTPHELASELSYFLADGPPDEPLRKASDAGDLKTPRSLAAHVERLLQKPAARQKMQAFLSTYFGIKQLADGKGKDPTAFPMFTPALKKNLVEDGLANAGRISFDGDGSFDDLFDSELTIGASLQNTYGTSKRTSILTHPAVIAAMSNELTTSPVHRGLFFRKSMLCNQLPPPPANAANDVAKLSDPSNPNGTQREQWAYFKKASSSCAGCHALFHPLGLGLENYDPIGRLRTDDGGKPIDLTVAIDDGNPEIDGTYKDGPALAKAIAASRQGRVCFALQYTSFAFGRSVPLESKEETCRLEGLVERFDGKPLQMKQLLMAMVEHESFFYRSYP